MNQKTKEDKFFTRKAYIRKTDTGIGDTTPFGKEIYQMQHDYLLQYMLDNKIVDKKILDSIKPFLRRYRDKTFGEIMVDLGYLNKNDLSSILHKMKGVCNFSLQNNKLDKKLLEKVPRDFITQNVIVPLSKSGSDLYVAIVDINDILLLDKLRSFFDGVLRLIPVYASAADILSALDRHYGVEDDLESILKEIRGEVNISEHAWSSPVVRAVAFIVSRAMRLGASDVHFEPSGIHTLIRYRIDGVLQKVYTIEPEVWDSIIIRIKVMCDMDIAERRHPQDGRASMEVLARDIDLRISTQPTIYGENCVIRILDGSDLTHDIKTMNIGDNNMDIIESCLNRSDGMMIVTGPTGSGKTTTIYSMLRYLNSIEVNIMTIEDPVEFRLPLVRQSNVSNKKHHLSFEESLKALMRQDPDIIFVGEIRDPGTASLAIRAAMTGHKVLTSLHTNDALGAIPRLIDIGVDSVNAANSLSCILSQRLARKLCTHCRIPKIATDKEKFLLGVYDKKEDFEIFERNTDGCHLCSSGCKGRTIIIEVLFVDQVLRDMISSKSSYEKMTKYLATCDHFISMQEFGAKIVLDGLIDLKELRSKVNMTNVEMEMKKNFLNK